MEKSIRVPVILKKDINKSNPDVYVIYRRLSLKKGLTYMIDQKYLREGYHYAITKLNKKEDLINLNLNNEIYVKEDEIVLYNEKNISKPLIEPQNYKFKIGDFIFQRDIPSKEPINYIYDSCAMIVGYVKDCQYLNELYIKYLLSLGIIYLCVYFSEDCGSGYASQAECLLYEEQCIPYVPDEEYDFVFIEGKKDYEENYKNK